MSPLQLIAILGLATGASFLLGELEFSRYFFANLTGLQLLSLHGLCTLLVPCGMLALGMSRHEKRHRRR